MQLKKKSFPDFFLWENFTWDTAFSEKIIPELPFSIIKLYVTIKATECQYKFLLKYIDFMLIFILCTEKFSFIRFLKWNICIFCCFLIPIMMNIFLSICICVCNFNQMLVYVFKRHRHACMFVCVLRVYKIIS